MTELERIANAYNAYCLYEFNEGPFTELDIMTGPLDVMYTTDEEEEHEFQASYDVADCCLNFYMDNKLTHTTIFRSLWELAEDIETSDFDWYFMQAVDYGKQ